MMILSYLIITVHELSHLLAAKFLGLSISHITIYPFGINLKLKNTIIFDVLDEIILYMSGPLSNIIMALLCIPFFNMSGLIYRIYYINIALFITNILPIEPLDGGMVVKRLLCYRFGQDAANRIMKCISVLMLIILVIFFVYLLKINSFNPSVCIFIFFIFGNIFIAKDKYNKGLLKELLYCREKKSAKKVYNAKVIGCMENTNYIDIAKKFNQSSRYFVILTDNKSNVKKIITEEQVIDKLLRK